MDVRNEIIEMVNQVNGSWPVAAAYLGMSETALRNRAYESKGQALRWRDALRLQELSQTTYFAEAIAAESGGTFIKLPEIGGVDSKDVAAKFHELYAELGELSVEFRDATADGKISKNERERINDVVDRMHKTMDELRAVTFVVYCPETKAATVAKRGDKHD
ncbi:YmfL family putative regulatory protein [Undibacterium curvum]|uniref:Uncharacterized protein n=1 Tax=Undibacterium curvum TaxID=2762294 RepID=A0ABR7A5F5_9BURK|nr:YmfL family putative regulatory protein [Undibacterium curvum]MBC3931993.1 hypothetical protein [Undibacterium curvum]